MIIYDPYGELKKVVDEIKAMKETKITGAGDKRG